MTTPGSFALRVACLLLALAGSSCRQENPEEVLARVGPNVLTRSEANAHVDTTSAEYGRHLAAYVASWVNTQLIYQEARRSGVEDTDEFAAAAAAARRQLANQRFLETYLAAETLDTGDTALRAYYDTHASEFMVREEMVKLHIASFARRDQASAFVARFGRGSDWSAAFRPSDSAAVIPPRYYTQRTLFPAELWKAAGALALNETSFPVKTAIGYVVVQPVAVARQGTQAEFDAVRDEVRERLVMEHRNRRYRELLGTLRQRYTVEVLPGAAPPLSDTTSVSPHD